MECEKALQDLWLIDQPNGPHFSGQINYLMLPYTLCVIFTILVSFSRDNALFASKAKINVF